MVRFQPDAFSYAYGGIGNRTSAVHGGGAATTYQANSLNQYTSIQSPGSRWILGEAPPSDAVTINGVAADRAGAFFSKQLTESNTSPLWSENTIASNGVTVSGHLWTPAASFVPSYDPDGNLLSDGRWVYTWDGENRLIRMETTTAAASAGVPRQRLDFAYDVKHRRVSKTVWSSNDGSNWTFTSNRRFLYDGWNLIAEYTAPSVSSSNLSLDAAYTWGIDLSGTAQGAGGVGGLLSVSLTSHPSPLIPAYDGNGNISAWMGSAGELLEKRDYTPFGGLLMRRKSAGAMDVLSKLRFGFSTKYEDPESGLLYYGYRYYDPVTGRWPSRDPIEEEGGLNVYGMVGNDPISNTDFLGQDICVTTKGAKYLFTLDDKKPALTTITADEAYRKKYQWFEPFADNYLRLLAVSSQFLTMTEVKHTTWAKVAGFSMINRYAMEYASGSSGDWKAQPNGGDKYLLVDVDGAPYWADAIGQIPFAVNTTKNLMLKIYKQERNNFYKTRSGSANFSKHMIKDKVFSELVKIARSHASGNLLPGNTANEGNNYDIYMVLRGGKWAFNRYDVNYEFGYLFDNYWISDRGAPFANMLSESINHIISQ